ncbi:p53-like transcription factor [Polychaeton citri CBS 116435]|uniref:P53-like transcription factor n=1 Tax=Polychaeton citri CBS 116435 TaxID=1314669 RepID=A0A9P4Q5Q7_9PEZI|nr:p53-like transcription factor [Polychaeton citri CBS 116435]
MDISGFDPSTMTYLATQMAQPNVAGHDPFQEMLMPMDSHDHHSTYGFAGSDADFNLQALQQHHTPQLKRFSSVYEDPFSDVVSAFDVPTNNDQRDLEASIDRDNKLLSFSLPSFSYTLLDYTYRRTTLSLSAQLHGMFFLAESPWASGNDVQTPPTELTCYRRNLFQITGDITLPRTLRYILTESGEQIPILGQELVISATESTEGNAVKIISVPWKTPANPSGPAVDDKVEREPPSIPLDMMNVQDVDSDFASFPFQWKRLQFRIATANNGRRKELQQHFVVHLKVIATLATGGKIPISEVHSGPIIVRGRSPRNFQSRKDLPLNGSGHVRKSSNVGAQASRGSSGDSVKPRGGEAPTSAPVKVEHAPSVSMADHNETQHNDFYDWNGNNTVAAEDHDRNAMPPPRKSPFNNGAQYPSSSPDLARSHSKLAQPPSAPISLSLVEDDSPKQPSQTPPDGRSSKRIHIPARAPSFSVNTLASPDADESADLLYEYFPLGLDDWMPPVDAVYRPHVVHHIRNVTDPRDPKSSTKGQRSKRYFSEDVT